MKASSLKKIFKYYLLAVLAGNIIAIAIFFWLSLTPWALTIIVIFNAILAIPTVLAGLFIFFYQIGENKEKKDLVNEFFSKTNIKSE